MSADGKWLDQGKLFKGERPGRMQIGCGQHRKFAQSPINMDPKNLEIDTAIRFAPQTGWAGTASEIGAYCAIVALHEMAHVCSNGHYFNTEFVPKNSRIRKEWLVAVKGVVVGSADADLPDANQRLCGSGHRWISTSNQPYLTR